MIIFPPMDSRVFKPDSSRGGLFSTSVCFMQDGRAFAPEWSLCSSVSQCDQCLSSTWDNALFFPMGNWVIFNDFSAEVIFQSPNPLTLCVDTVLQTHPLGVLSRFRGVVVLSSPRSPSTQYLLLLCTQAS